MHSAEFSYELGLSAPQYSAYKCLCYFNIFGYPLRANEVLEFNELKTSGEAIEQALSDLIEQNLVFEAMGFYSINQDITQQIAKRVHSENRFLNKLSKIRRFTTLVSKFPFVEFVGVSGTCAKGLFDKDADVDYFIVAKTGRLWLGRSFLVLFKKIVLFNSRTYFCLNYFIDDSSLELPDRNIFTAHEFLSMAPVSNPALYQKFRKANNWANQFLPNKTSINISLAANNTAKPAISRLIEKLFDSSMGDRLDSFFLKLTVARWRRRFPHFSDEEFETRLKSTKNISKHHPKGYQKKVLNELQKGLAQVTLVS